MHRWKSASLAGLLVLALALLGCQDGGDSNEDLIDPGTMPVMTDGAGAS